MRGRHRALGARLSGAALVAAALASCSSPSPPRTAHPAKLKLAGTEYVAPLLRAEILAFQDRYPEADSIHLVADGSAEGIYRGDRG